MRREPSNPQPRYGPSRGPALVLVLLIATLLLASIPAQAAITNRYLVLTGVGCTVTTISTNTNCWSLTSGGTVGASVPGPSEMMVFDSSSGSGTVTLNAPMNVYGFQQTSGGIILRGDSQSLTIGAGGFTQTSATSQTNLQSATLTLNGNFNNVGSNIFDGGDAAAGKVIVASDITFSTQDDALHFYDRLVINSGVTMTLLTDIRFDEWEGHLTVDGTLNADSHNLRFQRVTVDPSGHLLFHGQNIGQMDMSMTGGNTHTILLTDWTLYQPQLSPGVPNAPLIAWAFNPNTASATVTMTFNGMFPSTSYQLKRDGTVVATASSDSTGAVTFAVTGGWSSHNMEISRAAGQTRFLVLDGAGCVPSAISTNNNCWSASSGGAGGAGVPGIADIARLDGASGSVTGTMNAAMTVALWDSSGFTGTITTGNFPLTATTGKISIYGTFNAGSSVLTANGDFNVQGTFNIGTSTVIMAASGNIYPMLTFYTTMAPNFYKLTINTGVTATIQQDDVRIDGNGGQLTVNGVLTSVGSVAVTIRAYSTQMNPLVVGPSGDISALAGVNPPGVLFRACEDGTYTINLPSTTYPEVRLANGKDGWNIPTCVGGPNVHITFNMLGPISTVGAGTSLFSFPSSYGNQGVGSLTVKTNGFALTTATLSVFAGGFLDLGPGNNAAIPTDFRFSTNTGTIVPVSFSTYSPQSSSSNPDTPVIAWRFTPSASGAAVTITFRGMVPSTFYDLKRDGVIVDTETSDSSGIVVFIVTGGWSTHDMVVSRAAVGVGGGAPPPPGVTPGASTTVTPPVLFHDGVVIISGIVTIIVLAIVGYYGLGLDRPTIAVLAFAELAGVLITSITIAHVVDVPLEILTLIGFFVLINLMMPVIAGLRAVSLYARAVLSMVAIVSLILTALTVIALGISITLP